MEIVQGIAQPLADCQSNEEELDFQSMSMGEPLWDVDEPGYYCCAKCSSRLFHSNDKIIVESLKQPLFEKSYIEGCVELKSVTSITLGVVMTSIRCANCDLHVGWMEKDQYLCHSLCLVFEDLNSENVIITKDHKAEPVTKGDTPITKPQFAFPQPAEEVGKAGGLSKVPRPPALTLSRYIARASPSIVVFVALAFRDTLLSLVSSLWK